MAPRDVSANLSQEPVEAAKPERRRRAKRPHLGDGSVKDASILPMSASVVKPDAVTRRKERDEVEAPKKRSPKRKVKAAEPEVIAATIVDKVSVPPRGVAGGLERSIRALVHRRRSMLPTARVDASLLPGERSLLAELTGLSIMAGALLCVLALVSYSASDPGFSVTGDGEVKNWIGPVGAYVADGMTLLLGLGAYGAPFMMFSIGLSIFRARVRTPRWRQLLGAALGGLGTVTLLQTLLGQSALLPYPPGGLFGVFFTTLLVPALYSLGTAIVAIALGVSGICVFFNRSIAEVAHLTQLFFVDKWHWAHERYAVWREEQRLLDEEHSRLSREAREERRARRAEKRAEAVLREERIREQAEGRAVERVREDLSESELSLLDADASLSVERSSADAAVVDDAEASVSVDREPSEASDELSARSRQAAGKDPRWVKRAFPKLRFGRANDDELDEASAAALEDDIDAPAIVADAAAQGLGLDDNPTDVSALIAAPVAEVQGDDTTAARARSPRAAKAAKAEDALSAGDDDGSEGGLKIVERADEAEAIVEDGVVEVEEAPEIKYELPPLKLLDYDAPERTPIDEEAMLAEADKLVRKFKDFGIDGRVREVRPGPVVTTYEFVPAPGIKVSRIAALSDDIAMAMEAVHVRIVAPIPGKGAVGIEIPNEKRETVYLKEIIASDKFRKAPDQKLLMALGKDIEGKPYTADLASMPHVLISGTTGSGKSVSVNAMICSVLYRVRPDEVKFIMIDPKMLELSIYDGIPHLLLPPIIDSKKAANALAWAVQEMDRRYKAMADVGVRDLEGYNAIIPSIRAGTDELKRKCPLDGQGKPLDKFPYIVIVVDEYADLLAIAGKEVEGYVMRLAQKARAAGIHVMLATQRPSVDVITGVIKANFPVRMGFRLASSHDSKTIINRPGAEKLLGRGDMLIMPPGTSNVTRVHGAFISEKELHRVVEFLKSQGDPNYDMSIINPPLDESGAEAGDSDAEKDVKWDEAIAVVAKSRKCSTSWLQRQLGIGYNRAARIVEMMEREGLVGPTINAKGDRDIYLAPVG